MPPSGREGDRLRWKENAVGDGAPTSRLVIRKTEPCFIQYLFRAVEAPAPTNPLRLASQSTYLVCGLGHLEGKR